MSKEKFHPFQMLRGMRRQEKVLGWQYEMIYLGGDPENPEQATVHVRTLERAVVVRSSDGKEENFRSLLIPYTSIEDLRLKDGQTGHILSISGKPCAGDVYEIALLQYRDGATDYTLELRMSMAADIYKNSQLCRNLQKYVAARLKKNL